MGVSREAVEAAMGHRTVLGPRRRRLIGDYRPSLLSGSLLFGAGLLIHMVSLKLIEQFTTTFPSLPDVLMARLPYVDFGIPGELYFFAFFVVVAAVLMRSQAERVPSLLAKLGIFYAFRGVFLFLMPIGSPADAPPLASRFVLYPFPSHAYFPGGHVGLMTMLSLSVHETRWRRCFLLATGLFAAGTILARTHYTADSVGGWLLGYAITSWSRRHFVVRPAIVAIEPALTRPLTPRDPVAAQAGR